jgi:rare lipoprotein A
MELIVKQTKHKVLLSALLAIGCSAAFGGAAHAIDAPEITSSVWEEGNAQCASVSLNGKELLAFRGSTAGHTAEQRAEDLADKLQDLVEDDKFDANKVVPAREGEMAALRLDGNTIMKFDATDESKSQPLEQSLKLVNSLRTAYGVPTLPASFLQLADSTAAAGAAAAKGGVRSWFSGAASWYGPKFHGRKCSDGSRFDMNKLTAAHRFLPFGTKLLVRNRKTGDTCVVSVNDRGPFIGNRVIDLSKGAARQLNMLSSGVAIVDCIVLGQN